MLLGANFIDKNVASVHLAVAEVELKNATHVPIVCEEKPPRFLKDVAILSLPSEASKRSCRVLTVSKFFLSPGKQTRVLVSTNMVGTLIVKPPRKQLQEHGVSATN